MRGTSRRAVPRPIPARALPQACARRNGAPPLSARRTAPAQFEGSARGRRRERCTAQARHTARPLAGVGGSADVWAELGPARPVLRRVGGSPLLLPPQPVLARGSEAC
ncbi:unnamed protein product [Rangifer tarandus platyrhynchus]|uniref:Uncharacterized protein n=2 Tax=Rangifer tarandus platyrhynchus TaxID=3082113 RepID=A0ABN8XYI1_RANTA|nr:unnamed protein product [Rangifer tarandus platyrhynchus]CAI9713060.1 unnamed protein product [Rangifer tarandus platyrhynchus]